MTVEALFQRFVQAPTKAHAQALQQAYPEHACSDFATGYLALQHQDAQTAILALGKAYHKDHSLWQALFHRAEALQRAGRFIEAAADYEQLLRQYPQNMALWQKLLPLWHATGEQDRLLSSLRFLTGPEGQALWKNHPDYPGWCARLDALALLTAFGNPQVTQAQLWQQGQQWYTKYHTPPPKSAPSSQPSHSGSPSLHIAYLSNEWQSSPVQLGYTALFAYHAAKKNHKIYAVGPSPPGEDLRPYFEDYLLLEQLSDRFDVFVDLSGWFHPEGFLALCQFPHRVKILLASNPPFWGPAPLFDAVLADPYVLPRAFQRQLPYLCLEAEGFFHWQPGPALPQDLHSAQRRAQQAKAQRHDPEGFRLGATASPNKINADTLRLWAQSLRVLPQNTQLTLKGAYYRDPLLQHRLRQSFAQVGGNPKQLAFEDNQKYPDHYSFYLTQDLILDSTPYNGALSSCDAYWAGTPVVALDTQRGIAQSLYANTQTQAFLAETPQHFVAQVVNHLQNPERLRHYAYYLPQALWQSALCEGSAQGERMEKYYLKLWQEKQQKNP